MLWRGKGYKAAVIKRIVWLIKQFSPPGFLYNAPAKSVSFTHWIANSINKGSITSVFASEHRQEVPPEIYNYRVTGRFSRYYNRETPAAFVAEIRNGRVYGQYTNFILLPPGIIAEDLSRQFGAYGGIKASDSDLLTQTLHLPPPQLLKRRVAVISTSGADNFHHWLYDCLPRLYLLEVSGKLKTVDWFLIAFSGQLFQTESLRLFGIDSTKIINPLKTGSIHYEAEQLVVPSLPSTLGTVSPWVISFLEKLFNPENKKDSRFSRIYISRKKVTTRKIVNNDDFLLLLSKFGIVEVYPEDFSVSEFASILANTTFIISVHGSGLSNLCFVSPHTVVIDILAPYHQDSYYWMISNIKRAKYIGFFAEGEHPSDQEDLVRNKRDDDLVVNIDEMKNLLQRELKEVNYPV